MSESILVVDDEANIRQTLRGVLTDEGYDVLEAGDGRAALAVLERETPRLAIVDIWMPEMDGVELVRQMKQHAPKVPIIVISGHGTIETAVRVIQLGAFDFLEKPFPLDALLKVVDRALAGDAEAPVEPASEPALDAPSASTGVPAARTRRQRTIAKSVVVNGQGLHTGQRTGLILQPLPPNSGIVFGSISTSETVPALVDFVDSTGYATTLARGGMVAKTVEHLMATLHAFRITNLLVKMHGEVPIMDGSAGELFDLIEAGGIEEQGDTIDELVIDRTYRVGSDDPEKKGITIEPSDGFEVCYVLQYPAPIGRQEVTFRLTGPEAFKRDIARARTFGFVKEIEALEQMGLAAGGRLNNFILIGDDGVVNGALRFPDEFARHKILDLLGDLYLLGRPIRGRVHARMTGHSDNAALARELKKHFPLPTFRGA